MNASRGKRSSDAMVPRFDSVMASLPLTDEGNASRFVARNSPSLRYCDALSSWYARVNEEWQPVGLGELARRVIEVVECMTKEIDSLTDPIEREKLAKWQSTSLGHDRLKAMIRLAKSDPTMGTSPEQLGLSNPQERGKAQSQKQDKRNRGPKGT